MGKRKRSGGLPGGALEKEKRAARGALSKIGPRKSGAEFVRGGDQEGLERGGSRRRSFNKKGHLCWEKKKKKIEPENRQSLRGEGGRSQPFLRVGGKGRKITIARGGGS